MPALYDMSVPVYIRGLENLHAFLKKAENWAEENKVPKEKLLEAKLAEDMKGLAFQIQTCSNTSKWVPVRLGGVENEAMEDNETTFPQLYERIEKTVAFLKKAKAEDFEGKEEIKVTLLDRFHFTGLTYLQNFATPNFYFHETVAYAILRKEGVPVGKLDFLGAV